ncbi:MAG: hypothetical protein NUV91_08650 [Candidatus Omnitrophica bacterium]|nr:hypothetical protein [Candidatus Omnitrophota bacterium]
MVFLNKTLRQLRARYILKSCLAQKSQNLIQLSQAHAVQAFHNAYHKSLSYRQYIHAKGLSTKDIHDFMSFQKHVPISSKETVYHDCQMIADELWGKKSFSPQSLLLSSGTSGQFAFGLSTIEELKKNAILLEVFLDHYFQIFRQKTLIINCLSVVELPSIYATVVKVGPRVDSLVYVLGNIAPHFDQIIIIGDNYFLKNAIEECLFKGIALEKLKIHLILGGAYLAENLREHLNKVLLANAKEDGNRRGQILSSMGISEFGLNIFFESQETIALRKLAQNSSMLRELLFDPTYPDYLPMFLNYLPQLFLVEEIDQNVVVTNTNQDASLLLVRYNTYDKARILSYDFLKGILQKIVLPAGKKIEDYLPAFHSPLILMYGRGDYFNLDEEKIYPEQIQDLLFQNLEMASQITGYFRLSDGSRGPQLDIQLKKAIAPSSSLEEKFQKQIQSFNQNLRVSLHFYQDFPYGMELDYQHKFKYF